MPPKHDPRIGSGHKLASSVHHQHDGIAGNFTEAQRALPAALHDLQAAIEDIEVSQADLYRRLELLLDAHEEDDAPPNEPAPTTIVGRLEMLTRRLRYVVARQHGMLRYLHI